MLHMQGCHLQKKNRNIFLPHALLTASTGYLQRNQIEHLLYCLVAYFQLPASLHANIQTLRTD